MKTSVTWSTYDEEFLLDNFGSMKMTTLSKKLNRTEKAIKQKYTRLTGTQSIAKSTSLLESKYILEILGITKHKLIEWGNKYKFPYTVLSQSKLNRRYYDIHKVFDWIFINKDRVDFTLCKLDVTLDDPEWFVQRVEKSKQSNSSTKILWTTSEVKLLLTSRENKMKYYEIAELLDRSVIAVKRKMCNLKKSSDYEWYCSQFLN